MAQTKVETATVSDTVIDSGSNDDDTGIVYQGMPSSDVRCDLNCVINTGEDNQSSNTDSDMNGHDTGSVVGVESENMNSQPAFITDKLLNQSVSVDNDPETESSDSSCIAECCTSDRPY